MALLVENAFSGEWAGRLDLQTSTVKSISFLSFSILKTFLFLSKLPITQFILISGSSGSPYRVVQIKKKYGWSIFVIRSLQLQLTKDQKQPYKVATQLLKGFRFWLGLGSGLAAIIQIQ